MRDITDILLEYLEAKRHLWNVYFRNRVTSIYECIPLDQYEEIDRLLFFSLVVPELQTSSGGTGIVWREPIPYLRVIPREGLDRLLVMIGEGSTSMSTKWSLPTELVVDPILTLNFIEFFEWDRYEYVSFPYYRARVSKCSDPVLVGKDLLLEITNARVFFATSESQQ